MDIDEAERPAFGQRFSFALDRAEKVYLRVLRAIILVIATLLILYACWLVVSGIYHVMQSPDSVETKPATVAAAELVPPKKVIAEQKGDASDAGKGPTPAEKKFYGDFVDRYFALYTTKFAPYRQKDDKELTKAQFDDAFVQSTARADALGGEYGFESDKADLNSLLKTMTAAADQPELVKRLKEYKFAKRQKVEHEVQKMKTVAYRGWDSDSTSCSDWFYRPYGCSVTRHRQVPYTTTVTSMELPKGVVPPAGLLHLMQDRYFDLLQQRREQNASEAASERASIITGNANGKVSLFTALEVLAAFLVLMFFFLLIAIERHQRRISSTADEAFG